MCVYMCVCACVCLCVCHRTPRMRVQGIVMSSVSQEVSTHLCTKC